jgi:ABC-type transporter Mla subunit MlaD
MSVEVKGLADIVRQAKEAISLASSAGPKLRDSAQRVADKVTQVNDMIKQLDAADADLGAAIGAMSNGGPPLADTAPSSPSSQAEPTAAALVKYPKFS